MWRCSKVRSQLPIFGKWHLYPLQNSSVLEAAWLLPWFPFTSMSCNPEQVWRSAVQHETRKRAVLLLFQPQWIINRASWWSVGTAEYSKQKFTPLLRTVQLLRSHRAHNVAGGVQMITCISYIVQRSSGLFRRSRTYFVVHYSSKPANRHSALTLWCLRERTMSAKC